MGSCTRSSAKRLAASGRDQGSPQYDKQPNFPDAQCGDIKGVRGCSSMVELLLPKQVTRVRFPSPARNFQRPAKPLQRRLLPIANLLRIGVFLGRYPKLPKAYGGGSMPLARAIPHSNSRPATGCRGIGLGSLLRRSGRLLGNRPAVSRLGRGCLLGRLGRLGGPPLAGERGLEKAPELREFRRRAGIAGLFQHGPAVDTFWRV